jgi:hypothetical protein
VFDGDKPVRFSENAPVLVPVVTFVSEVVGLLFVEYTIPRSNDAGPPESVTLPETVAVLAVTEDAEPVVTVAGSAKVVNDRLIPYLVPFALMEYALTW